MSTTEVLNAHPDRMNSSRAVLRDCPVFVMYKKFDMLLEDDKCR